MKAIEIEIWQLFRHWNFLFDGESYGFEFS